MITIRAWCCQSSSNCETAPSRFRAAYDFLLLRAQVGAAEPELAEWWTRVQTLPHEERVALVQARPAEPLAEGHAPLLPG